MAETSSSVHDADSAAWAADHKGTSIWCDPSVKFLDPFTKSGVFLREITARLVDGLEDKIPEKSCVDVGGSFEPTPFGFNGAKKGVKPGDF